MWSDSKNTEYPPDPSVLCSKLDQYPDEAWGWDSVLNRDPHPGEDPNQECSFGEPPQAWAVGTGQITNKGVIQYGKRLIANENLG